MYEKKTNEELAKLQASRKERKKSLNDYWKKKDPTIVKTGKASKRSIQALGLIFAKEKEWISEFAAEETWARERREEVGLKPTLRRRNQHSDNHGSLCDYVDRRVQRDGFLELSKFKEKYEQIYGHPSKSWDKENPRIKKSLNLITKCKRETYISFVGKRKKKKKTCIRHTWRFERKTEKKF